MSLPLPWDVAVDAADILLATGRTVNPLLWIDRFVRDADDARAAGLPHHWV